MTLPKQAYLLLALFIANILVVTANTSNDFDPNEGVKTSLYDYKTVATSEDNFKNLFYNLPKYVKGGDMVDFLSYEYVGTIKNKSQTKKYLKKNFKRYPHFAWATGFRSAESGGKDIETTVQLMPSQHDVYEADVKEATKTISDVYVNVGYEVYVINFVYALKQYSQYMFVDPNTKKVVLEGNVFGVTFPSTHFEYVDSQN